MLSEVEAHNEKLLRICPSFDSAQDDERLLFPCALTASHQVSKPPVTAVKTASTTAPTTYRTESRYTASKDISDNNPACQP